MIRQIIKGEQIFEKKAEEATIDDLEIALDMVDTLRSKRNECAGLAANMIGYNKRIIVFEDSDKQYQIMFNPVIVKKELIYSVEEGCLSLDGNRKTKRYKKIKVEFYNKKFEKRIKTYTGFTAEVIQHEIDHLEGIII